MLSFGKLVRKNILCNGQFLNMFRGTILMDGTVLSVLFWYFSSSFFSLLHCLVPPSLIRLHQILFLCVVLNFFFLDIYSERLILDFEVSYPFNTYVLSTLFSNFQCCYLVLFWYWFLCWSHCVTLITLKILFPLFISVLFISIRNSPFTYTHQRWTADYFLKL